ncbi:MAG: hypothetical protein H7X95_05830 [Deltaproteobacteria bacterium]|nr:hypothetical protein [Deltaproteobacteria bacterium]
MRIGGPAFSTAVGLIVAGALIAAAEGCGTDDVGPQGKMVGGRCTTDNDCVNRCLTGTSFPGGYCTVSCATDSDCPGGAACVATNGGACLATCRGSADCAGFGREYKCSRSTRQSGIAETAGIGAGAGTLTCTAP